MADSSSLPSPVDDALTVWLAVHDRLAPGLIEGLYVVGSAVLDDWHAGVSDVDIMAFTSRPPDTEEVDALRAAHVAAADELELHIDGPRLVWVDVAEPPVALVRPWSLGGEFHHDAGCFELNPVMWHTLSANGFSVRGPTPLELSIVDDPAALRSFVQTNTDEYWRSLADGVKRAAEDPERTAFDAAMTSWCVLGVARMLHTIRTGQVTSKTVAGLWLADQLPEYGPLIDHAVAVRRGGVAKLDSRETAAATADYLRAIVELVMAS